VNDGGEDVSDDADEYVAKISGGQIQLVSTAAPYILSRKTVLQ
jgi:hypothetical protein